MRDGINEWIKVIAEQKDHKWDLYMSETIKNDLEKTDKKLFYKIENEIKVEEDLDLKVSMRSFRADKESAFVNTMLNEEEEKRKKANEYLNEIHKDYPILFTRDLQKAKEWLLKKEHLRGNGRYGIIASSGAFRLRKYGINVKDKVDTVKWFLKDEDDVRSSYSMEQAATEFDVQGLELDWAIVCWDANLRYINGNWEGYRFRGTRWERIREKSSEEKYLINAYRVLLTRARQGFIIYLPKGDEYDKTTAPGLYNSTAEYFRQIGIKEI